MDVDLIEEPVYRLLLFLTAVRGRCVSAEPATDFVRAVVFLLRRRLEAIVATRALVTFVLPLATMQVLSTKS